MYNEMSTFITISEKFKKFGIMLLNGKVKQKKFFVIGSKFPLVLQKKNDFNISKPKSCS